MYGNCTFSPERTDSKQGKALHYSLRVSCGVNYPIRGVFSLIYEFIY